MLVPDGVYRNTAGGPQFVRIPAPTRQLLQALLERISVRIGRQLERRGIMVRDAESSHLALESLEPDAGEDALAGLQGHSITYRVAFGPRQGQKIFTLQTLPPRGPEAGRPGESPAANGFSLHAGVAAEAWDRPKLERLCRYISRPAISAQRLSLSAQGNIRYALKSPYRDGTTHVVFEPLDFLSRLAALVPAPRVNLTRFHGVFAPHHRWRAQIVPGPRDEATEQAREQSGEAGDAGEGREAPVIPRMNWAQCLKRVCAIEIEQCERCGGRVRIIAVEDQHVIQKILSHLGLAQDPSGALPRGPPQTQGLFD